MPKAFIVTGPRTIEYSDYELPPLGPRDVLLESVMSGISHGTELNLYRGSSPFATKRFDSEHRLFVAAEEGPARPTRLGYEMVSRVVEVGSEVREVQMGDLVHSATNHQPATVINLDENAHAEIPMQVLPAGVSPEEGVFAALMGVALAAIHDAQVKLGDRVAIFGLGTIGLIALQLARLNGALRVVVVDPIDKRRALAEQLGADLAIDPDLEEPALVLKVKEGQPPDVVIEASGTYQGVQGALRAAPMAGRVVTLGYYQGGAAPVNLGEEWHHNRLTMISSMAVWGCPSRYYPHWDRPRLSRTVMTLLAGDMVVVEPLITHRFSYWDAPAAYQLIDEHPEEAIKVVFTY